MIHKEVIDLSKKRQYQRISLYMQKECQLKMLLLTKEIDP